jgi:hypothetical protein
MAKTVPLTILFALGITLTLAGCGSTTRIGGLPPANNINGNWTATLTNPEGSVAFRFTATFTQESGSELSITNLVYTTSEVCPAMAVLSSAGGSFTSMGSSNGKIAGTFQMSEILNNVGGPMLTLQGTLSNSTISGTWSVSGLVPPCSGNGTFTIVPATTG